MNGGEGPRGEKVLLDDSFDQQRMVFVWEDQRVLLLRHLGWQHFYKGSGGVSGANEEIHNGVAEIWERGGMPPELKFHGGKERLILRGL